MNDLDILDNLVDLLPFLIPLALIQFGLMIWALIDVAKRQYIKGNRVVWILLIIFLNIIGPIVYFLIGRQDGPGEEDLT